MDIKRQVVPIKLLIEGYVDKGNEGVEGFGGNLDIRPPYQREFVYDRPKQIAVIDSVLSKFPLSIMYWVDHENGRFEVLDGQQRILSICKFHNREFSIEHNGRIINYDGLTLEEKRLFLDYELDVYTCAGTEREKLQWFERINVIGEPLTKQELRNASYTGPWLADAKSYFSKDGAAAERFSEYMVGSRNRQAWLETVISWISQDEYGKENIEQYMADHKSDEDAKEMWQYFFRVMNWTKTIFPNYRKEMKGVSWGLLYNEYKEMVLSLNPDEIEDEVVTLMSDIDVKNPKGIYTYIFDKNEKHLNLRAFSLNEKRIGYEQQKGICANTRCPMGNDHKFSINEMEADHITPWSQGGQTTLDNLQLLCRECNRRKGAI